MHIAKLIAYMGAPFDQKTSEYLLVGLLTDSGNFSHDDVTEETLNLGAKLLSAGADMLRKMKKTPLTVTLLCATVLCMLLFSILAITFSTILYILIGDAVHRCCLLGDVHLGVYASCLDALGAVDTNLHERYLHNPISCGVDTCGLKIEEYYWSFKF